MTHKFTIEENDFTLAQALKFHGLVASGGQGKMLISEGRIRVNGEVEFRKRRKMVVGDVVEVDDE